VVQSPINHNTLRKLVVVVGGLGVRSVALEIFVSIDGVGLISSDQCVGVPNSRRHSL